MMKKRNFSVLKVPKQRTMLGCFMRVRISRSVRQRDSLLRRIMSSCSSCISRHFVFELHNARVSHLIKHFHGTQLPSSLGPAQINPPHIALSYQIKTLELARVKRVAFRCPRLQIRVVVGHG